MIREAIVILSLVLILGVESSRPAIAAGLEHRVHFTGDYSLFWSIKASDGEIEAALVSTNAFWLGFGVSESGTMSGGDLAVCSFGETAGVEDYFSVKAGVLRLDSAAGQDWDLLESFRNETHVGCRIRRKLITCDDDDWDWNGAAPVYLIWARGSSETSRFGYHGSASTARGSYQVSLNLPENEERLILNQTLPSGEFWMSLQPPPTQVPAAPTTYMCTAVRLDASFHRQLHITEATATAGSSLIHHIIVYHCPKSALEALLPYDSPQICPTKPVSCEAHLAWGAGQSKFKAPQDVGIPFGGEKCATNGNHLDCYAYFLIEHHYNNPASLPGIIDNSAFLVKVTPNLRRYAMGLFIMGPAFPSIAIPPKTPHHLISSECPTSCTSRFPEQGINVMATQLHMHGLGSKIRLQVVRNGAEMKEFAKKDYYDFEKQSLSLHVPFRKLLPGDRLILSCVFDSSSKTTTTRGGWQSSDEMCGAYLAYYPRMTGLIHCSIAFDDPKKAYCGLSSEQARVNASIYWDKESTVSVPALQPYVPARDQKNEICMAKAMEEVNKNSTAYQWSVGAALSFFLFIIGNALFHRILSKICENYRELDDPIKRNVQTYVTILVTLFVALILVLVGGLSLKVWDLSNVQLQDQRVFFDLCLLGTSTIGYIFLFELCFRVKYDGSIAVHHILTAGIIGLLSETMRRTLDPFWLLIGVLLSLNAILEQPTYVGLFLYRVRNEKFGTVRTLATATVWTIVSKSFVYIVTMVYLIKHSPQKLKYKWLDQNMIEVGRGAVILTGILSSLLYIVQLRCAWIMWLLCQKVMERLKDCEKQAVMKAESVLAQAKASSEEEASTSRETLPEAEAQCVDEIDHFESEPIPPRRRQSSSMGLGMLRSLSDFQLGALPEEKAELGELPHVPLSPKRRKSTASMHISSLFQEETRISRRLDHVPENPSFNSPRIRRISSASAGINILFGYQMPQDADLD